MTGVTQKALSFLQLQYHPPITKISLEDVGEYYFDDGTSEKIPILVTTSQQNPGRSEVRIGVYELNENNNVLASVLGHELGHMVIEWACRSNGITQNNEYVISH